MTPTLEATSRRLLIPSTSENIEQLLGPLSEQKDKKQSPTNSVLCNMSILNRNIPDDDFEQEVEDEGHHLSCGSHDQRSIRLMHANIDLDTHGGKNATAKRINKNKEEFTP